MPSSFAWVAFTLTAAAAQTVRNALQRNLTRPLGASGATQVRFLFGLPFAIVFLIVVRRATGLPPPSVDLKTFLLALEGAATQIIATALMLAAMRDRSFVVTIAYTKTEPIQVAVYGLAFLGDRLSAASVVAIVAATAGVMIMSWPRGAAGEKASWRAIALGLVSGGFFALSSIGFRAAILAAPTPSFVMAATSILVFGLFMQSLASILWLALMDRPTLIAIGRAWKPSLAAGAMGALASQFWFLAFALATAAQVRTLGVVEVVFAQFVSRRFMNEGVSRRELAGMALIVVGIVLVVNG